MKLLTIALTLQMLFQANVCLGQSSPPLVGRWYGESIRDNGGRLLISVSESGHSFAESRLFKVDSIGNDSPLKGFVNIGDRIFSINGYNLRNLSDVQNIVQSGNSGAQIIIRLFNSSDQIYEVRVSLAGTNAGGGGPDCAPFSYRTREDTLPLFMETNQNTALVSRVKKVEEDNRNIDDSLSAVVTESRHTLGQVQFLQIEHHWRLRKLGLCSTNLETWFQYMKLLQEADGSISRSLGGRSR